MMKDRLIQNQRIINEDNVMPRNLFDKINEKMGVIEKPDDSEFYKPSYVGIDNFDARHERCKESASYYDEFDLNIKEDRDRLVDLIQTEFEEGTFSTIARCKCGEFRGNYYVGTKFVCPNEDCGTPVTPPVSFDFPTKLWLRLPANVSGFINPAIYKIILDRIKTRSKGIFLVKYWINESYRHEIQTKADWVPGKTPSNNEQAKWFKELEIIETIKTDFNLDYGYNTFVENIDRLVTRFLNEKFIKFEKKKAEEGRGKTGLEREEYFQFWMRYKHCAISHYFPVPNKIISIIESDKRNKYIAREQLEVNKCFQQIAGLFPADDERAKLNEKLFVKFYEELVEAISTLRKVLLFGKRGSMRFSVGGGSLPFTARTVISGESGVCRTDTVTLPWHFVLTMLEKHLLSWLYRRGYTPVRARKLIIASVKKVTPEIEEFVNYIESTNSILVAAGRQPSIVFLSVRTMFARFNRDVNDLSMRIPITTAKAYGADYDGDQMYVRLITDMDGKIKSYINWGHQLAISSSSLFGAGRFYNHTKSNMLNINALCAIVPAKKIDEY